MPREHCVHTVAPCWLRDVHWLLWDKDSALQRTHQQSNHQGGPQRSTERLKDLLSIYQRRCWEGTSTLKQNWDIFFLMTAIYNRAWMTMKLKTWESIMMSTFSCTHVNVTCWWCQRFCTKICQYLQRILVKRKEIHTLALNIRVQHISKGDLKMRNVAFSSIVRLFSIQVTQWLCHNETCRLYNCLTTYFISWCNIPCSRIKMSPMCSGNRPFGPSLGDSCSLHIKLHG